MKFEIFQFQQGYYILVNFYQIFYNKIYQSKKPALICISTNQVFYLKGFNDIDLKRRLNLDNQFLKNKSNRIIRQIISFMYYTLVLKQKTFKQNSLKSLTTQYHSQNVKLSKQSPRLLKIVPLINQQAVLFYSDGSFFHVNLRESSTGHERQRRDILYQDRLQGRAFDAAAINRFKVIVLVQQRRQVVSIDLKNKQIKQIYSISTDSLYYSKKETGQFYLTRLEVFSQSGSFYVQQNLIDQRKVKIIFFQVKNQNEESKQKNNKIELQKQLMHKPLQKNQNQYNVKTSQFSSRQFIYRKVDQYSKIVKFKQNPQQNARFRFEVVNLENDSAKQIAINHSSCVLYSTITQIKQLPKSSKYPNQQCYVLCLNGKDKDHQIIIVNAHQATTLWRSESIIKQFLAMDIKRQIGIFTFFGRENHQDNIDYENLKIIDLNNGQVVEDIQIQCDTLAVSLDNNSLIEYSRQSRPKAQSKFKIIKLANKQTNYLKLMNNLGIENDYGNQFCGIVLKMLNRDDKFEGIVEKVQEEINNAGSMMFVDY